MISQFPIQIVHILIRIHNMLWYPGVTWYYEVISNTFFITQKIYGHIWIEQFKLQPKLYKITFLKAYFRLIHNLDEI